MRAPTRTTLAEAAEDWLSAAKAGIIRTRSGETYKPSALRAYEQVLRARVLPELGQLRLSSVTRHGAPGPRRAPRREGPLALERPQNRASPARALQARACALGGTPKPDARAFASGREGRTVVRSQSRTVLFLSPDASLDPSGEKATELTLES